MGVAGVVIERGNIRQSQRLSGVGDAPGVPAPYAGIRNETTSQRRLSLAQVHAALAYYHANRGEIDRDLESEARETEALEEQHRRRSSLGRVAISQHCE